MPHISFGRAGRPAPAGDLHPRPDDPGALDDGRARLAPSGLWSGLPVTGLVATAYVSDITDEMGRPSFRGNDLHRPSLHQRADSPRRRAQLPGHFFWSSAVADDPTRFGDWAGLTLSRPSQQFICVACLPHRPEPDCPQAGRLHRGRGRRRSARLTARLLRRADTGEAVQPDHAQLCDGRAGGRGTTTPTTCGWRVGLAARSDYSGEIELAATTPNGLADGSQSRPSPSLPVTLTRRRSAARIQNPAGRFRRSGLRHRFPGGRRCCCRRL